MILTPFSFLLMASIIVPSPSPQERSSPSELIPPPETPLKEEVIEPFLFEGERDEEEEQLPEGLQDTFDKGTPDVFVPREQKNE